MKSPEEKADNELGKTLRDKFAGFNAPVKDQVRVNVFAALGRSSDRYYWIFAVTFLLILGGLFVADRLESPKPKMVGPGRMLPTNGKPAFDNEKTFAAKGITESAPITDRSKQKESAVPKPIAMQEIESVAEQKKIESLAQPAELEFLVPIDSVNLHIDLDPARIALLPEKAPSDSMQKPGLLHGVKGIFSASVLQTFQFVHLSQAASDRVQNFQFAPALSSKSLSYRMTAGIEKKHTQLLLSYTYLRNWSTFEIGTNQLVATRIGERQYTVRRIGEAHVADDRSHLIGIGVRQSFTMAKHILRNYALHVGLDYTRELTKRENLLWGNVAFTRQVYESARNQFVIGPYFQYSFMERKVEGHSWKWRPYQVGISLGMKLK